MKHQTLLAVALLALGIGGCAKDGAKSSTDHPPVTAMDTAQEPTINSDTRYAAGQLAESRGDYDAATQQYRLVLSTKPKCAPAMYRLGCVYAIQKKYPESIAMWKQYLKATDECAAGYSNLAFTEELAGNPAGAELDYKRGISKDPHSAPCRVNYGLMLARHGRLGESVIQLQTVLSPAEVHFNIASIYEIQHREEQARIEYRQALALDPNFVDARDKLASLGDLSADDD